MPTDSGGSQGDRPPGDMEATQDFSPELTGETMAADSAQIPPRSGPAGFGPPRADVTDEFDTRVTNEQPGRYQLGSPGGDEPTEPELGRGGIGRVLITYDSHLGREVAAKELLADRDRGRSGSSTGASISMASRFLREARVTGQLEHPSIVPVYELGRRRNGALYYTMKLVRGRTMGDALADCDSLEDRLELLSHFIDLCQALAYAHSRGVVHRDVKPANVMLGEFGETVVLDWGLAKVQGKRDLHGKELERDVNLWLDAGQTLAGSALGTPAFMSPEQADGRVDDIDERSDVWSLGVVLYQLLTGRLPFEARHAMAMIEEVKQADIRPVSEHCPEAPPDLAAVAEKALRRDPADLLAATEAAAGMKLKGVRFVAPQGAKP